MPPLYGLGYIQSRYSYMTEDTVLMVMKKMRDNHIPCDLIFCDIDYMDHFKVFTWDKTRFAHPRQMVDSLKKMGAHLYVILDPALKIEKGYSLYDQGIKDHHFAYYPGGQPFTGYVWAGASHYTNFLKAGTREWRKILEEYVSSDRPRYRFCLGTCIITCIGLIASYHVVPI